MGLCKKKRNKRCIPKEGMSHASACQKIKRCIPKEGMPHAHKAYQKKREKEEKKKKKDSPYPKKKKEKKTRERWFIQGVHPPSTKNTHIHTLAHLDQGL